MTVTELSDLFDVKLNTFISGVAKDEYEKSVYLTRAQDVFYDELLSRMEETENVPLDLKLLIRDETITPTNSGDPFGGLIVQFPSTVRKILREKLITGPSTSPLYSNKTLIVTKDRMSEVEETLRNPFREPNYDMCVRIISSSLTFSSAKIYIHPAMVGAEYIVSYAESASPIILEDLPNGLTIKGENTTTVDFKFGDSVLLKIVDVAVTLALSDLAPFSQAPQPQQQ